MSASGSGPSNVVQKINGALGVRLLPRPPEGFDPVQASDRELLEYGYPVRPNIDLHPLVIGPGAASAPDYVALQGRPVKGQLRCR